jgi:hypothetical protein
LVKSAFLSRLARVYGEPRNIDGLALELSRYMPAHATEDALEATATRLIQERKAKGFPSAAELIPALRGVPRSAGAASAQESRERYENCAAPMEWIKRDDPRWDELCRLWRTEHNKPAFAATSKYASGEGWFFPLHHVDALALPGTFQKMKGAA